MRTESDMTREQLMAHLDAFGADPARWPAAVRASVRAVLERDPQARRLQAEARALERLLDRASPVAEPAPELIDRIVRAARGADRARVWQADVAGAAIEAGDNIIALPRARGVRARADRAAAPASWRPARRQWQGAGGLLAASLLLGIWLGASGAAAPSLSGVLASRAPNADIEALSEIVQSALPLEGLEGHDEDQL